MVPTVDRGLRLVVHLRVEVHEEQEDVHNRLAFRAALEPEMTAKVDDAPMPPPPPRVLTPEELAAPLASVPENPPPAPPAKTKTKKKPKKKTSVAAAGASLDVATARLQKEIATPGASPAPSPKPKTTASAGKSSKSKGLPDAGPIQN